MTTYLLDELTIGHIGKTIRVENGRGYHKGKLVNFFTEFEYAELSGYRTIKKQAALYFDNGEWYANMSETFTVIEDD